MKSVRVIGLLILAVPAVWSYQTEPATGSIEGQVVNATTGAPLDGFEHVEQSLNKIFTTRQGERVMREWFGNPGLRLLGENATPLTVLLWFTILWTLIELFEPRYRVRRCERRPSGHGRVVGRGLPRRPGPPAEEAGPGPQDDHRRGVITAFFS